MSFVVVADLEVLQVVSTYSPALQFHYQQICRFLAADPYPAPKLPIRKETDAHGNVFYQYFDGIIPVLFHYRVYAAKHPAMVYIASAIPIEIL